MEYQGFLEGVAKGGFETQSSRFQINKGRWRGKARGRRSGKGRAESRGSNLDERKSSKYTVHFGVGAGTLSRLGQGFKSPYGCQSFQVVSSHAAQNPCLGTKSAIGSRPEGF
jgi:hypothetical protein